MDLWKFREEEVASIWGERGWKSSWRRGRVWTCWSDAEEILCGWNRLGREAEVRWPNNRDVSSEVKSRNREFHWYRIPGQPPRAPPWGYVVKGLCSKITWISSPNPHPTTRQPGCVIPSKCSWAHLFLSACSFSFFSYSSWLDFTFLICRTFTCLTRDIILCFLGNLLSLANWIVRNRQLFFEWLITE